MDWTWKRAALAFVDGFAALSAIGGGYAVMVGAVNPGISLAMRPFGWLISDYFVAGEILVLVTGGTALAALIATLFSPTVGGGFSAAAGLVMMGWIMGEVVILGLGSWLQVLYFAVGVAMLGLALLAESPVQGAAKRLHIV
jgi:hypothetical protein